MGCWGNRDWCANFSKFNVIKIIEVRRCDDRKNFSIIKPDAVKRNLIGAILTCFEQNGFEIIASKMVRLTREQAEGFYAEHQGKEFLRL